VEISQLKTDVLIIGGGLAGCNAALGAAERGASVVVVDKGKIERSGDIGGGVDHFLAFLETGAPWDTRKGFLSYVERVGRGTNHLSILERQYCDELPDAIERMARIGNPLTRPDGKFFRTASMGQPGPYWINFNGKLLKPRLGQAVRKAGCRVMGRSMIVDLLTAEDGVSGAIVFNIRSGAVHAVHAKATVIATGNTNRLYENPRLNAFNTWLCPFNTGDGQVLALNAGAVLTNMEFMRMTVMPKGFSAPGFNALTGMGGRFMNSLGDYYMEAAHTLGNRAPRYDIVFHTLKEIREGRGPVYVDCRHLSDADHEHLMATLGYDKDTLPDYIRQRGEDLRKAPIEVTVSEGMQAGPTEVTGSGIKIDAENASTVPGLFAAGDAADHNRCVHGAVTGGYRAGKFAAAYALSKRNVDRGPQQIAREKVDRFVAPLHRSGGYPYEQIESAVRKIMAEHVGPARTELGLKSGLAKLARLETSLEDLRACDLHELMRCNETRSILAVGKIMATTALYRTESRNKPYHHRIDYPETDDAHWHGLVTVRRARSALECAFERT